MPRVRLAVALLVPEPVATEIDGLRRALGDPGLTNVVPHITLITPVNIAADRVPEVLADLRAAAASTQPMTLQLGPPATFSPVSPVVYLSVGDDRAGAVHALRDALRAGALARPAVHDFVPHVTITENCLPERIEAVLESLAGYIVDVEIDRLHLLRDRADGPRRWNPVADALFEPPLVVGTGGLPMEISFSGLVDPEVSTLFDDQPLDVPTGATRIVLVARRERDIIAAARGWMIDGDPTFAEVVGDPEAERQLLKGATWSAVGRA
ncbi:MAG TPA: 2'-5' RNA ligase family protein [Acidimicrobiales bacterium]|nr:2'-5' RNA ligase family protein [Acidimicrobiales bacterium]